jgi:hypothetical protein
MASLQVSRFFEPLISLSNSEVAFVEERLDRNGMIYLRKKWQQLITFYGENRDLFIDYRDGVFQDLYEALKIRDLAIGQLTLDGLDQEMREFCTNTLDERNELILTLESYYSHWNDLVGTRNTAITLGKQIAQELDDNIRVYDETIAQGHVPGEYLRSCRLMPLSADPSRIRSFIKSQSGARDRLPIYSQAHRT